MVNILLSFQCALMMDELLITVNCLLAKHNMLVTNVLQDKVCLSNWTEGEEVMEDLTTTARDSFMLSNHKAAADFAVSPPPLPWARTNQRAGLLQPAWVSPLRMISIYQLYL